MTNKKEITWSAYIRDCAVSGCSIRDCAVSGCGHMAVLELVLLARIWARVGDYYKVLFCEALKKGLGGGHFKKPASVNACD